MENVFQVEYYEVLINGQCIVDGRFIEGNRLRIGDVFKYVIQDTFTQSVTCHIADIQMYGCSINEVDIGMTARLVLNTTIENVSKGSFELISK